MLARASGVAKLAWTPATRQPWRPAPTRRYAVDSTHEPEWFHSLRAEMLSRDITYLHEDITIEPENRLANTLSGFLPPNWCSPPTMRRPVVTPGHHLIWFNPALPADKMLPDGTDASQSPGDPWVRRMWAGGSVTLNPGQYYHSKGGFLIDTAVVGVERIKDVRLRGQGDTAKLFVTIERRFARLDHLYTSYRKKHDGPGAKSNRTTVEAYFKQQLRDDEEWGDSMLKEERELVFLKERSAAALEAIKAGQNAPVKYLDRPGEPELSLALTPTRSLLFRFSALTFNAHLIHLDREYARSVEGHRNLLVHGPLSLTLMMQAISNHARTVGQTREVVQRIDYRNLAPLYCDEEMRICARKKSTTWTGSTYDIWIEGPTGGVAVKGTVQTEKRSKKYRNIYKKRVTRRGKHRETQIVQRRQQETSTPVRSAPPRGVITVSTSCSSNVLTTSGDAPPAEMHRLTAEEGMTTHDMNVESILSMSPPISRAVAADHTSSSSVRPDAKSFDRPHQDNLRQRLRMRSYRFVDPAPPLRHVDSHRPLQPRMSPSSRYLLRRLTKRQPENSSMKPIPIVRTYNASPYEAFIYSRFRRDGIRKIVRGRVRVLVSPYPRGYRRR